MSTIEQSQSQSSINDPFSYLYPHDFMRLTTFRKNGVAVPTTVWFAPAGGKIYVTTTSTAGKIKRIRNNSRVLLAPSDRVGQVLSDKEITANARELTEAEHPLAYAALTKKYGSQFEAIASRAPALAQRTYFVIEPQQES